jgi:glutaredoxin
MKMRISMPGVLGALLLLVALAGGQVAGADWLVLRDGARVETRGEWEVKGKLVVFHNTGGKLASLRLSEVDLEASDAATAEAVEAAKRAAAREAEPEKPPEKREPVLVLTDADVGHVDPDALAAGPGTEGARTEPRVILYATSWCGYCRKTRTLLASLNVPYVEKDIEKDPAAGREFLQRFGRVGVPVLDFDGVIVRGFNEQTIRAAVADFERRAARDSDT